MEAENTKNGWVFTSKAQESSTRQQRLTATIRTASQKGQIERLWRESRLSSRSATRQKTLDGSRGYGCLSQESQPNKRSRHYTIRTLVRCQTKPLASQN